ncbi:MAG: AraC family transcriptional regulator [Desulfobacteraceae bacterium]|nr:AraC family transcriptional regulator [Desulfobacteraceae bacterium]
MNQSYAINGVKISSLFEILEEHSINRETFLESVKIDGALFNAHEKKLTVTQVTRVLKKAVLLTGDENLGLQIGLRSRFLPNIVCYIMINCLTVGDALLKYCRYKRIFNDDTNVRLSVYNGNANLEMDSNSPELSSLRVFNDYLLTSMYVFLRFLTKGEFNPTWVHLNHDQPENLSEYNKAFSCPISFSQPTNSLIFTRESLNLAIKCPNQDLLNHFEEYAQKALNKISKQDSLPKTISRMLIKIIQNGNTPSVELIASRFNMSVRKLQGLLEKEKTSYKKLLHSVKKELAFAYLSDRQISSSEVSYLIGFSEPSAFYRAFKKWTGSTPSQFRTAQSL